MINLNNGLLLEQEGNFYIVKKWLYERHEGDKEIYNYQEVARFKYSAEVITYLYGGMNA